jgi:flagellar basal body-associated protein FliL
MTMPSPATPPQAPRTWPTREQRPAAGGASSAEPGPPSAAKGKNKDQAAPPEGKPKKKKLPLIIGAVVVLALIGFKEKGLFLKPHYAPGHPAPDGLVYPLPTTSPITVTTADGKLVQTGIALQLTTVANTKELTKDEPAIENAVISVLGSDTYAQLLSPSGRAAAQQAMLRQIQQILGPVDGSPQVVQVLFTGSFVLQP